MTVTFQPIKHVSTPDIVKRKIRQATAPMFVREFTQNAIEAAAFAANPRVIWFQFEQEDYQKLAIWNNGHGMTADELIAIMDLGASGNEKMQSAADNFGLGAKLTGLKANREGLLWRSCKDGIVSQLLLGWQDDAPGIIPQDVDDGMATSKVIDVSAQYAGVTLSQFDRNMQGSDCPMLSFEWTMVVFLGRDLASQNTVWDPLGDGNPIHGVDYWLPTQINRRFYDLARFSVSAYCNKSKPQFRHCRGLYHIPAIREESIEFSRGRIRYCILKEPKSKSSEEAKGYRGHCALVFKNEIYDGIFMGNGGTWPSKASRFGVFAGHERIAIHVVLADSFNATPTEQRTTLEQELPYGGRNPISLDGFEVEVEENMPDFMREFISQESAKRTRTSDRLKQRIKKLMERFQFRTIAPKEESPVHIDTSPTEGQCPAQPATAGTSSESEPRQPETQRPPGERLGTPIKRRPSSNVFGRLGKPMITGMARRMNQEPTVSWELDSGEPSNIIGSFDESHNLITLKEDHPVLGELCAAVLAYGVSSRFASEVREEAKDQIGYAAIRHALYAKALCRDGKFTEDQFKAATSPESLTASLGDFEVHVHAVEVVFRGKRDK